MRLHVLRERPTAPTPGELLFVGPVAPLDAPMDLGALPGDGTVGNPASISAIGVGLFTVSRILAALRSRSDLLSEAKESWGPFQATQMVTVQPPAFDWEARIAWAPGVTMFVRDAYAAGTGSLHAAAFGLVTVADQRGTPELAQGELMRYLAEAAWYPTALLPSGGVRWEAIDDSTARASFTDGATSVALDFRFDQEGLITRVRSPGRYRDVNGVQTLMPWQGRFRRYAQRSGMRIPLEGEVEWVMPTGPLPYWRGRITDIVYETAR
ncbi:MAG: DUF6920 family protein [Candidatus Methylomirabilis sp.]